MKNKNGLVCGVAVNDANYQTMKAKRINGKAVVVWRCPYYTVWWGMIKRCYKNSGVHRLKSYIGCTVCDEWLMFSNFRSWMEKQDWYGNHLDKDILIEGNKQYSPAACAFVSPSTNNFLLKPVSSNKDLPVGVCCGDKPGVFIASCRNPFSGKVEQLGVFMCHNEAHLAWRKRKKEHAAELAKHQTDKRVADKLLSLFS